jgi:hypothetical protein
MEAIRTAFTKLFPECFDVDHYLDALKNFQEGEWFCPTNANEDFFTKIDQMAAMHLVAKKVSPRWNNGSFMGLRIEYMYKNDLKY